MSIIASTALSEWQQYGYTIRRDKGLLVPKRGLGNGNQQRYLCCNRYTVDTVVEYKFALVCNTCRTVYLSTMHVQPVSMRVGKEADIYEALE